MHVGKFEARPREWPVPVDDPGIGRGLRALLIGFAVGFCVGLGLPYLL